MKQYTHYNAEGSLVLDFTGDKRWLVEPKGDELHLTPVHTAGRAGTEPSYEETNPAARPIILKFDKAGSLSAVAVCADRVRKNIEDAAKVKAAYESDLKLVEDAKAQAEALEKAFQAKYGK